MKTFRHRQPEEIESVDYWWRGQPEASTPEPTIRYATQAVSGVYVGICTDPPPTTAPPSNGPTPVTNAVPPTPRPFEGTYMVLTGREGGRYSDLIPRVYYEPGTPVDIMPAVADHSVHLVVQVIGLRDDAAPSRNYGLQPQNIYDAGGARS